MIEGDMAVSKPQPVANQADEETAGIDLAQ